jgi:glucose/arabinose dehydrogenase
MRNLPRPLLAAAALAAACLGVLTPAARAAPTGEPELVAGGLATPWEVVLLPDGRTWVTERDCRLRSVGEGGSLTTLLQGAPDVTCRKFLGLALHPAFAANGLAYLYETYEHEGARRSRIVRLAERDGTLERSRVVLDGIGSDLSHDGGRLAFGPDGRLYATTGDVTTPRAPGPAEPQRQDPAPRGARRRRDGSAPADNPFVALGGAAAFVWSYGHRHPQGLAWDALGRMWATEHGPSGSPRARGREVQPGRGQPHRARRATTAGRSWRAARRSRAPARRRP